MAALSSMTPVTYVPSVDKADGRPVRSVEAQFIPRVMADFMGLRSTSGTAQTTLYSYTIPGSALSEIGSKIRAFFMGDLTYTGVLITRTLFVYLDGTLCHTGFITYGPGAGWTYEINVCRIDFTTATIGVVYHVGGGTTSPGFGFNTVLGLDFSAGVILKVDGQVSNATGPLNGYAGYVVSYPTAW